MRVNISLNDFRRDFNNIFPGFILRVRDGEKDIAYYNGNKAFVVEDNKDSISLSFPINTYKCNTSDVINNIDNKDAYISSLINICNKMTVYYDFSMSSIPFQKTGYYSEVETKERLELFKKHVLEYAIEVDVDDLIKKLNSIDYTNKEQKNKTIYIKFNERIKDVKTIINIQYHFINDLKVEGNGIINDTVRGINFSDFKAVSKYDDKIYEVSELDKFSIAIKEAIDSYKGKDALEKKYQHLFMLNGKDDLNLFKIKENGIIKPLEQEYNLKNKRRDKEGRIDCVFYQFDTLEKKVTDIYLIELKVNEDVVLGNNGVLTHLDDIQSIINDKSYFMNMLDIIEYRLKKLDYTDDFKLMNDKCNIDYKIYFYTICGFTKVGDLDNVDHEKVVFNLLRKFDDKKEVNNLILNNKLDSYFIDKSIYDIAKPKKDKYEIRFFFDTLWVRDDKTKFKSECSNKTNELFLAKKGYFDE